MRRVGSDTRHFYVADSNGNVYKFGWQSGKTDIFMLIKKIGVGSQFLEWLTSLNPLSLPTWLATIQEK